MNAIVAIGGGDVARVAAAYHALVPSAVWMLGSSTRDAEQADHRLLDALLEPFMKPYFAGEAGRELAALRKRAAAAPSLRLDTAAALNDTAQDALAQAMALVEMLDRAHALLSVELVLTDDGSPAARTAVAWAHARGLPSLVVPDQTRLGRTATAGAGSTVVAGAWARRATAALPHRANDIPLAVAADGADRPAAAALRANARAAFTHGFGWTADDVIIAFEPVELRRDSALDPADGCLASLRCIFDAIALARVEVPSLRLVVLAPPSADVLAAAQQCAVDAGLRGTDYAYAITDHDVWFAGADIAVSTESWRSVEATAAGIPAVNVWRPANWYRGPAFSAEDGVLDVAPPMLPATLIALAGDADLRSQIAALAAARIGTETPAGPRAAGAIAREAQRLRRPAPPRRGIN